MSAETALERAVDKHNAIKGEYDAANRAYEATTSDPLVEALFNGTSLTAAEVMRLTNGAAQQMLTAFVLAGYGRSDDAGTTIKIEPKTLTAMIRGVFLDGIAVGARAQVEADA